MTRANNTALLLLLASLSVASGCGVEASVTDDAEAQAATPVPVETMLPFRGDIFATYEATATIESDADAPVPARVGGEVIELLVEEGDRVERGQVLARLDGERLRLEMLSAKANLEQVRGEFNRYVDLHERGLISASMFDGLRYDLKALEATYERKKLEYDYSGIRAPIAGVVSSRDIKLGQTVAVNDVTFRITDTTELMAHLMIPQAELAKFSAGHSAVLRVDAMPETYFAATIDRVSPTIDTRNGTFKATAIIDNEAGDLAPGMFARFTISYERHPDALLIPVQALVEEDDRISVYVVVDGAVTRRYIETGIIADNRVEVVAGLEDGDEVVVVGQSGLRDGSKVFANRQIEQHFAG